MSRLARLFTHDRTSSTEPGWASSTLDLSIRRAVSIPNLGGPLMMVVVLLVTSAHSSLAIAAAGVFLVVCVIAVYSIVVSRLALGWLFAASAAAVTLTWIVAPSLDHVVTFANCWMTNFTSVNAALVLRGRGAVLVPVAVGVSSGLAIHLAHPEWDSVHAQTVVGTQVAIGIFVWLAMRYLRDFAAVADEEARKVEHSRSAVAVADAASRAAAESSRTLHDTVVNTLGAIANGGRVIQQRELVRSRCARDVAAVESLLDEHDSAQPHTADAFLDAVVALGRSVGIEVRTSAVTAGGRQPSEQRIPLAVLLALRGAVHEALLNAAKHSGARSATVDLRVTARMLSVIVHDDGTGFRADAAYGFGLAESILGRCRENGIDVRIDTGTARGTVMTFEYPVPVPREVSDRVTPLQATAAQQGACWAWAAGVVAVGSAVEFASRFGVPGFTWAMLGLVAGTSVAAWLAHRVLGRLPWLVQGMLIVSTPAAFVLALAGIDFGHTDPTTLQILGATVPPIILLFFAGSARPFLIASACLALAGVGSSAALWWSGSPYAALVFVATLCTLPTLAGFAHFHSALADIGAQILADERAGQAHRQRLAVREAAELARARWQTAGLQSSIALLERIGNGDVDPVDPRVRGECSREERYLRQLLTLSPDLLHIGPWLTRASDLARRRNIELTIRTGDLDAPDDASARHLGELIQQRLATATAGSAMTVGIYPHLDGGCLVIVGDLPEAPFDTAIADPRDGIHVRKLTYDNQFLVEAQWRSEDGAVQRAPTTAAPHPRA